MRVDINVDSRAATSLLRAVALRGGDMRPAMTAIRELLIEGHAQNFASRGAFLGTRWPDLAPGTLLRKARQGQPNTPMVATGALQDAIEGGPGRYSRISRSSVSVGVSKDLFYARFHLAGARRRRGGRLPARPTLGINESQRRASLALMERYLAQGLS